jgi:hypothetical protein
LITIKGIVDISKWFGLFIMFAAFPTRTYVSSYWGDMVMAFGLGVAISLGVVDMIGLFLNDNDNNLSKDDILIIKKSD